MALKTNLSGKGDPSPFRCPEDFWAKTTKDNKPGISVRDHCLNVGCVAEALRELLPESGRTLIPPAALILAALHDVGKISVGFLRKCPHWLVANGLAERAISGGWQFSESNHAAISQDFFFDKFPKGKAQRWAIAVGGHHGRFLGKGRVAKPEREYKWLQPEREKLFAELMSVFGPTPDAAPESDVQLLLVAGWITVADWIGSNEIYFPLLIKYDIPDSQRRVRAALQSIRWGKGRLRSSVPFGELFRSASGPAFEANPLQQLCLESIHKPGLYLIEAPMGGGKTETALAVAHRLIADGHNHGLYFALPTQLTSNRIHERVEQFLLNSLAEETDHPLAHANSWLHRDLEVHLRPSYCEPDKDENPDEHVAEARSWFASSRQALLARHGVGTIDQALLGAVAAKYCAVRLFGLAGKVVILDEVHSYDAYTGSVMDKLIERLLELKCTVLVLSATLTAKRREELLRLAGTQHVPSPDRYPLLSFVGENGQIVAAGVATPKEASREISVQCHFNSDAEIMEEVCATAERGACVLFIKNTVAEAQDVYATLQSVRREGGPEIGLLHSRFQQFRRERLEGRWMRKLGVQVVRRWQRRFAGGASEIFPKRRGCVLVATQVVEQSVDIDADLLVTDLAPTDMLLQRIGRLWRHDRGERPVARPEVWVLCPQIREESDTKEIKAALGKSARVYAPYVLLRSLEVWRKTETVHLPGGIRPLLEATYEERSEDAEPAAWIQLRRELKKQIEKMRNEAFGRTNIFENIQLKDEEGVQTRWNDFPTASLVLLAVPPEPTGNGEFTLQFLNGEKVIASVFEWRFPVAAAIHRNAARLPLYAAFGTSAQPQWLRLHFKGAAVCGIWDGGTGNIAIPAASLPFALNYHHNLGVKVERTTPAPPTQPEEDDESWF